MVELLDFVDVTRHAVKQKWERNDKEIVAPQAYAALLQVPVTLNGSYEISVEFTRESGSDIVGLVLPIGDRFCNILLSTGGGAAGYVGDGAPNKIELAPNHLTNGKRYILRAKVSVGETSATVDATLGDTRFERWTGTGVTNEGSSRQLPLRRHLGLYAHESKAVFHSVKLTLTTGKAAPDPDAINPKRPK
jgi:hypothetical protein